MRSPGEAKPEGAPFPTAFKLTPSIMDGVTLWANFFESGCLLLIPHTIQGVMNLNSLATGRSDQWKEMKN